MKQEKKPLQNIDKWNPPTKKDPIRIPRATITDNYISVPDQYIPEEPPTVRTRRKNA
jgi:hypothetical protein